MKKILIVDDAQTISAIADCIPSLQYETVCASTDDEALELYGSVCPDLVLCELDMPQFSGMELFSRLSERYRKFIPILFLSSDSDDDAESRAFEAGAMDYIRRPFRGDVLLHRIDSAMRQIDSVRQLQGLKAVVETDPMTGLLNKVATEQKLADLCTRSSGTLLMIDLDNFKLVNDLHGHGMGDRVIIRFADILRGVIRSSDDVVGRVGGDEFVIFLRDARNERLIAEKASAINKNLLASAKEYMGEEMNIPLGASIGAVMVPDEGTAFEELFKKADKALYSVKQNGKHGYAVFHGGETRSPDDPVQLESPSLLGARKILEERNWQSGAYEANIDDFRSIFRFVSRRADSSHYDAEFILFSFDIDVPEAKADAFGAMLHQTLRRSDVYTRSSHSQFMVLLSQPIPDHGEPAIRRVMGKWSQLAPETKVVCEHEPLLGSN
ncbi:MAG: diguanylate cyclase [Oscillospiraceae bacterium]|nr:diguanylate cyclase [Oscillospiraceae bacterium]